MHLQKWLAMRLKVEAKVLDKQIKLERDKRGKSKCIAWFGSAETEHLVKLLKLHNTKRGGYELQTRIMGYPYPYDEEEEEDYGDEEDDNQAQDFKKFEREQELKALKAMNM